ncbi:hypothetical protein SKAU_G00372110 [Synaphobranchus kaupii]|uniref:Uncharacterized protein n=1 Tax=Synaphobranchus kaupii TaxID=118154 RepID=A0A9Q1EGB0_SYNKA|nr:hypothetical protein SKAU_G00372110 [Synaphobranchus kaupii]
MRKGLTLVLLVLTCLKTGRSKSRISVFQRLEDGVLTVTCKLLSEDRVTQINWEIVLGQNRSKADVGNSSEHCCLFNTFPSGNLEACADFSSIRAAEESEAHVQPVTQGWWKVVAAITVVSVLILIVSHYLRRRYYNSRRKVFQVEQAFLTDPQIDSNASTREPPQSSPQQESSEAFDPSKLYAKIKIDYYYGRLWKAYTRGWTVGPQPKIYQLLGEHPPQQKDNEEPQQG